YGDSSGLLSGKVAGKLFIDMSTVRPQTEIELAAQVRAKGAGFVECPVGGTVGPARQGKLIGLMGGEDTDAARARPILEQLCRRLGHVGQVGTGAWRELAINLPLLVYWQALGEALALSRNVGMDPARLMDLLADTSGGTNVIKVRGPAVAAMLEGGDPGPVGFRSMAGSRICARCSPKAKTAVSICRSSSARFPASSARAATAGAGAMPPACRSTGCKRPPADCLGDPCVPRVRLRRRAAVREEAASARTLATWSSPSAAARSRGTSSPRQS